ncbi:MAG: T9SS type A sorting domain-containing protein [Sporocytophaga sp.]|nr:T9SS type A sorting domain-containing protein [Sporocytophaga sp.]
MNKSQYAERTYYGFTTGLEFYFRLNEGTGQTLFHSVAGTDFNYGTLGGSSAGESSDPVWISSCVGIPKKYGSSFENPVSIGVLNLGTTYNNTLNTTSNGYDNDIGDASDDVYYSFTLNQKSNVVIHQCGSAISDVNLQLLYSDKAILANTITYFPWCSNPVTAGVEYVLNPGTYYVVSEGTGTLTGNITTTITSTASSSYPSFPDLRTASGYVGMDSDVQNNVHDNLSNTKVYPNPVASDVLYFGLTAETFILTDLTGSVMAEGTNSDHLFVDQLPSGIYFINIDGKIQKVVVQ